MSEADALEHLLRRYLQGFGPATRKEAADWCGLPVGDVSSGLERMQLRRFRDEKADELVDLPRAPIPDARTKAPARFLPVWDASLLVHARGTGILPEEYRPLVFNTKTPHSINTFLVDGAVAGSWRWEKGKVRLDPFERLPAKVRRELDAEARRLAALHA
jgi:hypothetical protein